MSTVMIRGIIHHQNNRLVFVSGQQKVFKKNDETIAIFAFDQQGLDLIRLPVIRADHMQILAFATERRDGFLLPTLHPAV